jgi:ABC-type glycerol-3-phosphate transport system substrate-binding protein
MIQGPAAYSWGGTWIAVCKGTKNPAAAKELVKYLVSDPDFLTAYAGETGDVVSNLKVQAKIKGKYKEPYLKGQNHYKEFCDMAKNVNGNLVQGTDQVLEELFGEEVRNYIYEGKAKKDAIKDFKDRATEKLGL